MRKIFYFGMVLGIAVSAWFLSPVTVTYGAGQLVTCSGDSCRACDVAILMLTVMTFVRNIGSIIATIIFMWAGFKLVTSGGSTEARSAAKNSLTNVVIGVIIMLTGLLIVNTIMQILVGDTFFGGTKWYEIQCVANPTPSAINTGTFNNSPTTGGTGGGGTAPSAVSLSSAGKVSAADEATVRQQMKDAGVTFAPGITPVGLRPERLAELAGMAKDCAAAMGQDCGVRITSGVRYAGGATQVGAHGDGYAIDVTGRSQVFNDWMNNQSGYSTVASFKGNTAKVIPGSNAKCTWEAPDADSTAYHWHCQP